MTFAPLHRRFRTLLKIPLIRGALHYLFKYQEPKKWIFITGCYNSGTTLLASILEADVRFNSMPGEGARYTRELTRPEDIGWTRMWSKCIDYIKINPQEGPQKAEMIKKDWGLFYSREGTINIEKSITTVPRIQWFNSNFNDTYFVGIIRDPYAVAKGIQKKATPVRTAKNNAPTTYTLEMTTDQWLVANRMLLSEKDSLSNMCLVTYENLIKDPLKTLAFIYDSIGLEPPKLSFSEGTLSIDNNKIKLVGDENTKRIKNMLPAEVDTITKQLKNSKIEPLLNEHGFSEYLNANECNQCDHKQK